MEKQVCTDHELLREFAATQSEAAFEEIVARHAPLVFGVCRRVLMNADDVDDAAQATFMTLAHHATKLKGPDSVAGWLHGVAFNISRRLRTSIAIRRNREKEAAAMTQATTGRSAEWNTIEPLLDAQLAALPDRYRTPLILHHLQGRSQEETAALLQAPLGTISARLSRGREMLKEKLETHGLVLSAMWLQSLKGGLDAPPALPMDFARAVARAAAHSIRHPQQLQQPQLRSEQLAREALRALQAPRMNAAVAAAAALILISGTLLVLLAHPTKVTASYGAHAPIAATSKAASTAEDKSAKRVVEAPAPEPKATTPASAPAVSVPIPATAAAAPAAISPVHAPEAGKMEDEYVHMTQQLADPDEAKRQEAEVGLRAAGELARPALTVASAGDNTMIKLKTDVLLGVLNTKPIVDKMIASTAGVRSLECDSEMRSNGPLPMVMSGHQISVMSTKQSRMEQSVTMKGKDMPYVAVSDGKSVWIEMEVAGKKVANHMEAGLLPGFGSIGSQNVGSVCDRYDLISAEDAELDGFPVVLLKGVLRDKYLLRMKNLGASELDKLKDGTVQVWVDRETYYTRQMEVKNSENATFMFLHVTNIKLNVDFPDSTFAYIPPEGVKVVDMTDKAKKLRAALDAANKPEEPAKTPEKKSGDF